jgi:hypothetical protein
MLQAHVYVHVTFFILSFKHVSAVFWPVFLHKINRLWAQTTQNCEIASEGIVVVYIFIAMAQEDKLSIDKLDGAKNSQIWKYQMTAILEARELYGHIDGTLTPPSGSDSSSGATASFEKAQKKTSCKSSHSYVY